MSYYDNKNKQKFDGLIVKFSYKELKKICNYSAFLH
jgi:hypothetical protein